MSRPARRSRVRRWLQATVASGVAVGSVALFAAAAGGDPPSATGWWTSENPGVPVNPIPTLVPTGGPLNLPSDVPPGGLEVADETAAHSYAAVAYDIYGPSQVQRLVLKLAAGAADLPGSTVQACPLTGDGSFGNAYGGPLSLGPAYDCATPVPGVEDTTAQTVTFPVAALARGRRLAVAIVASGTGRFVFAAPDNSTVVVSTPPVTGGLPPPPETQPIRTPATLAPSAPPVVGLTSPITNLPSANPPAPVSPTPQPVAGPTPTGSLSTYVPVTLHVATTSSGGAVVAALLIVLAAVAIGVGNRKVLSEGVAAATARVVSSAIDH